MSGVRLSTEICGCFGLPVCQSSDGNKNQDLRIFCQCNQTTTSPKCRKKLYKVILHYKGILDGHMDKECKVTPRFWITFTMYQSGVHWSIHCRLFQVSSSCDILPFLPFKYLLCFQSHCKRRMYHQFEMG